MFTIIFLRLQSWNVLKKGGFMKHGAAGTQLEFGWFAWNLARSFATLR